MQSVVSYPERGPWGDNKYRGNCSGYLIQDIIKQYKLKSLSDFMVGGGTTKDVCDSLKVDGYFTDLNKGYDMLNMEIPERSQNIFWHPPYGGMIKYSNNMYSAKSVIDKYGFDPVKSDLSQCKDWDDFIKKLNYCVFKQFTALEEDGRMFILMGDWKQKGKLYSMLSDIAKPGTMEQIIIKMQHNCVSDSSFYSNLNFVPIVHEYLLVLRKDSALIVPFSQTIKGNFDIRNSPNTTWRDIVYSAIKSYGKMSLQELYEELGKYKKAQANPHYKDKIRQVVQNDKYFTRLETGVYKVA